LTEVVEIPRGKPVDDEETENDSAAAIKVTCTQPEADMLGLVFANILR